MVTNLADFYNQISNPLDNEETMRKLIDAYSKKTGSIYNQLTHIGKNHSGKYRPQSSDSLYSFLFNLWKKYITSMSEQNKKVLLEHKVLDDDFKVLQDYLTGIPNVKTKKEAEDILFYNNDEIQPIIDKYRYNNISDFTGWEHVRFRNITGKQVHQPAIEHRLYLNLDGIIIHEFAEMLAKKCIKEKLPFYFKFDEGGYRSDSFVVYSDTEHLLDYYQILQNIIKEKPEFKDYIYEPPVLTGNIDGMVGYGSEPETKKGQSRSSFNEKRADLLDKVITSNYYSFLYEHPDLTIDNQSFIKKITNKVIENKTKYLKTVKDRSCYDYYSVKHSDLDKKDFTSKLYKEVITSVREGLNKKTDKFSKLSFQYRKNKDHPTASISIIPDDINRAIRSLLPAVVKEYPELLTIIKQEIFKEATNCGIDTNKFCFDTYLLNSFTDKKEQDSDGKEPTVPKKEGEDNSSSNLGDYFLLKDGKIQYSKDSNRPLPRARKDAESEENYFEFLKLYHNTCEELLQNNYDKDSCYQLTKQQIIQDLPINSNIPSRYTGIMSEEEINMARINCGIIENSTSQNENTEASIYRFKKEQIIQDLPIDSKLPSRYTGIMSEQEIKASQEKIKVLTKSNGK